MGELEFPVLGTLVVFLVLVPALTMLSATALHWMRGRTDHARQFGTTGSWLLLVMPVIGPVIWLATTAFGQFIFKRAVPCLREHNLVGMCIEPAVFGTILLGITGGVLLRHRLQAARRSHDDERKPVGPAHPMARRLERLYSEHPELAPVRHRVALVDISTHGIHTRGWLSPRIEVDVALAARLDDDALIAALLHELEHVSARDPLRFLITRVCLALNPLSSLLEADHARWRYAREIECDARAVERGADAPALAEALVVAARPTACRRIGTAHLCASSLRQLELRVALLLHMPSPSPSTRRRVTLATLVLAAAGIMLAIAVGSAPLDMLHLATEAGVDQLVSP